MVPTTFYLAEELTCNILSETLVYDLGYINKDAFSEKFLNRYNNQEDFINQTGQRVFGSNLTGEVVNSSQMTKGNLNSGEKRHRAEKLKDACANSQYWKEGKLRCQCRKRDEDLPQI